MYLSLSESKKIFGSSGYKSLGSLFQRTLIILKPRLPVFQFPHCLRFRYFSSTVFFNHLENIIFSIKAVGHFITQQKRFISITHYTNSKLNFKKFIQSMTITLRVCLTRNRSILLAWKELRSY